VKKQRKIKIFITLSTLFFIFFFYVSCFEQSLKKISIQTIQVELIEYNSFNKVDKIIPGFSYYPKVTVTTKEGKKIKNPKLDDLNFTTPNNSLVFNHDFWGAFYFTFNPDFLFAAYEDYTLIVSSKYNNLIESKIVFNVDWYNFPHLIFKGEDGQNGANGYNGSKGEDGTASSPKGKDGQDGGDGGDGEDGKDGRTVSFDIAYYKVPRQIPGYLSDYFVIVYDRILGRVYLYPVSITITIDTSGGNGGNAGAGGKGGDGGKGYNGASDGKKGRDGMSGSPGKGGDAGDIYINCPRNFKIFEHFTLKAFGGKSGYINSLSFDSINLFNIALTLLTAAVNNGKDGAIFINMVNLQDLFMNVSNGYFDNENLSDSK
jgi:hypothetical protein